MVSERADCNKLGYERNELILRQLGAEPNGHWQQIGKFPSKLVPSILL